MLIEHANKQRMGHVESQNEEKVILANDDWVQRLNQIPFHSKSKHPN
jgi:hypothetical protein